jgi:Domain of unknown function (DUF4390)
MNARKARWLLVVLLAGAAWTDPSGVTVTPVVAEGHVFASFTAMSAFTDDARAVVQSGLLLTFTYTVELRRPSTIWFDHTVGETVVASSAKYDNLTGQYQVSKQRDGRVFWSEQTDQESQVRAWMTTFDQVPIDPTEPLQSNADYYVRVRLHASPRRTFSIWPWGRDDGSGRADFTFIR